MDQPPTDFAAYCAACGYSLRGIGREGRCPECGRRFDLDEPATYTDQPAHSASKPIGIVIAIAGLAALGGLGLSGVMILDAYAVRLFAGASLVLGLGITAIYVAGAIWAYHRLRLPMLPWLIAYWILSLVTIFLNPPLLSDLIDGGAIPAGVSAGILAAVLIMWGNFLRAVVRLLITIMLMSEAAFLISRMIEQRPRLLTLLLAARQHSTAFGIALIGTLLLPPLLILLLRLL